MVRLSLRIVPIIIGCWLAPLTSSGQWQHKPVPEDQAALLARIAEASKKSDWQTAVALWDTIYTRYHDVNVHHRPLGHGRYIAPFNQATIYCSKLHMLDSAFSKIAYIVAKLPDEMMGGYEHEQRGGIRAALHFVRLLNQSDTSEEQVLTYLADLHAVSTSQQVRAVIDCERANVLFKQGKTEEAEQILMAVIREPQIKWHQFKSWGDFRWSAISSWTYLGEKYIGVEYILTRLQQLEKEIEDSHLVWVIKYCLAKAYSQHKETQKAIDYYQWCAANSGLALGEYPSSFSERQDMQESHNFTWRVNEALKELQAD